MSTKRRAYKCSPELFTKVPNWKQSTWTPTGDGCQLQYTLTLEYYSAIKRDEITSACNIWRNFKSSEVSKRSHTQNATVKFHLHEALGEAKLYGVRSRSGAAWAGGRRAPSAKELVKTFWSEGTVPNLDVSWWLHRCVQLPMFSNCTLKSSELYRM